MTLTVANFTGDININARIHRWYPNVLAESQTIATALGTDPTVHDKTIETPPAALLIGPANSKYTNDLLLLINIGKGGNILPAAMGTAITAAISAGTIPAPPFSLTTP